MHVCVECTFTASPGSCYLSETRARAHKKGLIIFNGRYITRECPLSVTIQLVYLKYSPKTQLKKK